MEKKLELLRFFLVLALMAVPFYLILKLEPYFWDVQVFTASNVYVLLLVLGFQPVQQGYFIFVMGKGLEVAAACVGWRSVLAFLALLVATPGKRNPAGGLALIPILYGFNIFRLATSLLTNVFAQNLFDIVHGFLWTYSMTFLVLGLWWYWVGVRKSWA